MHTACKKFHQNVPIVRLYILYTIFFQVLQTIGNCTDIQTVTHHGNSQAVVLCVVCAVAVFSDLLLEGGVIAQYMKVH